MNKLFAVILFLCPTLTLAQPEVENKSEISKLHFNGSFRYRIEGSEKTDYSTNREYMPTRIRAEFRYDYDSTLKMFMTPQFAKTFGEPVYMLSPNTGVASQQQTSGGTVDSYMYVHEGYLLYKPIEEAGFKIGRQVFSYGDELVIGALEWNNIGRSFDAVNTRLTFDTLWVDIFFSKLTDNNTITNATGDVNFYGVYSSKKWNPENLMVDVYLFHKEDSSITQNNYLEAAGLRATYKWGATDYRIEGTKEFGTFFTDESAATQVDGEFGFTFDENLKARLAAEYFYAGKTYNQLYPTTHKWLGYADVLGRVNITGFVAHGKLSISENTTLGIDSHYFARTSQDAPVYKVNGTTALGTANASSSSFVGTEWDLVISHQLQKLLTLSGGFAYFNSGSYLTDQFGTLNPVFYFAQLDAKF